MGDVDGIKPHYTLPDAEEHLYDVTTFDRTILTTVTIYSEAVEHWIKKVHLDDVGPRLIGFDGEIFCGDGELSFGTIQFCVGDRCLIIQPLGRWTSIFSKSLEDFLSDRNNTFMGIHMEQKVWMMLRKWPLPKGVKFMDLGESAALLYQRPGLRQAGLRELVEMALGMMVVMPPYERDWGREDKLSDAQVYCACVDAFLCVLLGRWFCRDVKLTVVQ